MKDNEIILIDEEHGLVVYYNDNIKRTSKLKIRYTEDGRRYFLRTRTVGYHAPNTPTTRSYKVYF